MSATLSQLLNVHSQQTDTCLAYLERVKTELGEQPLLKRFGRSLDENNLRIPLHVEPFDVAKIRDEEARRQRELDNISMHAGDADAEKRIYAHRGGMEDESRRSDHANPEPLEPLEPLLETLEVAMILGDPGGGKSEALKGLAARTAESVFEQLDKHLALTKDVSLPVFADLPTVARLFGDRKELKALREFARDWLELGEASKRPSRQNSRTPTRALPVLDHPLRLCVSILKATVKRLGLDFNNQAVREGCSPALRKIWRDWARPRATGAKPHPGALLLLDAWDEVADECRTDEFKKTLLALSREPPARLLATSRIVGFEPGALDVPASSKPGALRRELVILPFRYEDTEQFISAFFPALATAGRLISDLRTKPMVMAMLQNPLLATLVCLAFDPGSPRPVPLPAKRAAVYRGVVQRLLGEEEAARKECVKRSDDVVVELEFILQRLAFFIYPDEIFTKRTLKTFCDQFNKSDDWKESCPALQTYLKQRRKTLFACLAESGLLTAHSETELKFLHLTFEEYFAAGRLAKAIELNGWEDAAVALRGRKWPVRVSVLIDKRGWDPRWREVIALTAGQLDPAIASAAPILETFRTGGDDVFHNRLCLAALCLAEAAGFDASEEHVVAALGEDVETWWRNRDRVADSRLGQYLAIANPPIGKRGRFLSILASILGDPYAPVGERWPAIYDVERIGAAAGTPEILSILEATLCNSDPKWETRRGRATVAVSGIGAPAGTPGILSALVAMLREPELSDLRRTGVGVAFKAIGAAAGTPEVLTALAAILRAPPASRHMREGAARALRFIGAAAGTPNFLSVLAAILRDPDASDHMREGAARAVGHIGAVAGVPEILAALAGILRDSNASDTPRCAAADALGYIETAAGAPEILSVLTALLCGPDTSDHLRNSVAQALRLIGAVAGVPEILAALAAILRGPDEPDAMRYAAAGALGYIGAMAGTSETLSALALILRDPDASEHMREGAAQAVERIGTAAGAPEILAALAAILRDPTASDTLRHSTAGALGHIGAMAGTSEILSALVVILRDPAAPDHLREGAAEAVGRIGSGAGAPNILAALEAILRDPTASDTVRYAAASALGDIGAGAGTPRTLSALTVIARDPNASDHMRKGAAHALGSVGAAAGRPEILAGLAAILRDSNASDTVRYFAADALGRIGAVTATSEILAALAVILRDPTSSDRIRGNVAQAVRLIGAAAGTPEFLDELAHCEDSGELHGIIRQFVEWRWFHRLREGFARVSVKELSQLPPDAKN